MQKKLLITHKTPLKYKTQKKALKISIMEHKVKEKMNLVKIRLHQSKHRNREIKTHDKVEQEKVSLEYKYINVLNIDDKKKELGIGEIPAKEIKLAKILMDKPAPHTSA